ncbi:hypothetical protein ACLUS7_20880 [Enterobacterales bacterium BD_CKDN230030183-1A_HGKHYDSX7]
MSIGRAKGMLTRVKKLERSNGATEETRRYILETFTLAITEGRMCDTDGPVVMNCLIKWLTAGETRSGLAGEGAICR